VQQLADMFPQMGRVQPQAQALSVEHERQQGRDRLAAVGQGHGCKATGSLQVRVVKQVLGVGNGRKREAVALKYGGQLGGAVVGQARAQ
jgi:hypothetical protein